MAGAVDASSRRSATGQATCQPSLSATLSHSHTRILPTAGRTACRPPASARHASCQRQACTKYEVEGGGHGGVGSQTLCSLQDEAGRRHALSLDAHFFRLFLRLANGRPRHKAPFDSPCPSLARWRARQGPLQREREQSEIRWKWNRRGARRLPHGREWERERGERGEGREACRAGRGRFVRRAGLVERSGPSERAGVGRAGESSRNGNGFSLSVSNADVEREGNRGRERAGVRGGERATAVSDATDG